MSDASVEMALESRRSLQLALSLGRAERRSAERDRDAVTVEDLLIALLDDPEMAPVWDGLDRTRLADQLDGLANSGPTESVGALVARAEARAERMGALADGALVVATLLEGRSAAADVLRAYGLHVSPGLVDDGELAEFDLEDALAAPAKEAPAAEWEDLPGQSPRPRRAAPVLTPSPTEVPEAPPVPPARTPWEELPTPEFGSQAPVEPPPVVAEEAAPQPSPAAGEAPEVTMGEPSQEKGVQDTDKDHAVIDLGSGSRGLGEQAERSEAEGDSVADQPEQNDRDRRAPAPVGGAPPPVLIPEPEPPSVPTAPSPPPVQAGQVAHNVPNTMTVAVPVAIEARLAPEDDANLTAGLTGDVRVQDVLVTKAMSARLVAPEGGFVIEGSSPETQWVTDAPQPALQQGLARWAWKVIPQKRGVYPLQLVLSARTVDQHGVTAETALPDQVIEVRVRTNYTRTATQIAVATVTTLAGGALAVFGERIGKFLESLLGW